MNGSFAQPRPAATVVVVRDGVVQPEVFMARRHAKAVFASHYVFPGGLLEPVDGEVHLRSTGLRDADANAMLGVSTGALNFYSAAIRELFEESAVLLTRLTDGGWALGEDSREQHEIQQCRDRLNSGELGWADFLDRFDLCPAYDALHYIAYWVTPRVQKRRFSTRFFLAVIPDGQHAIHDDRELTDSCWMTAADVLRAQKQGDMKLMHPTFSTLSDISQHNSVDKLVEWARKKGSSGEARLLPAFVEIDGENEIVMPGHPCYPGEFET